MTAMLFLGSSGRIPAHTYNVDSVAYALASLQYLCHSEATQYSLVQASMPVPVRECMQLYDDQWYTFACISIT